MTRPLLRYTLAGLAARRAQAAADNDADNQADNHAALDEDTDAPEWSRARRVVTRAVFVVCIVGAWLLVGAWARPWQFAHGNPTLHGATSTAVATVDGGCRAGEGGNLISCVQYLDFDADPVAGGSVVHVRHAGVRITDGARLDEDPTAVRVRYEVADPHRFRLEHGNPGPSRVLGSIWMWWVTLGFGGFGGVLAGTVITGGYDEFTIRRRSGHGRGPGRQARAAARDDSGVGRSGVEAPDDGSA